MNRDYPESVAGPYDPPPRAFEDREGREIRIERYDDEFETVIEMYEAFDPADRAQGIPPVDEEAIRQWLEIILDEECVNVLAWDVEAEAVVGHATLVPDGQGGSELAIFVLSAYQDAGIGTKLIEGLLGAGREAGVYRVWLTVERWNDPAVTLYRKVGFEAADSGSFELEMTARLREE